VRVRVDESGKNDFAARIELFGRVLIGNLICWADPLNETVANRDRAVGDDSELAQLASAARPLRPGHGHKLKRMDDV
jgi:hypothetical protein